MCVCMHVCRSVRGVWEARLAIYLPSQDSLGEKSFDMCVGEHAFRGGHDEARTCLHVFFFFFFLVVMLSHPCLILLLFFSLFP